MMFMWVASVTPLTGFNMSKNPILMPIYVLIILYYIVRYCNKSIKPLMAVISIFGIWYVASCIKYEGIQGIQFQPIYSILIAHVAFNIYTKKEFLYLFEKYLLFFCCLSLIVWISVNLATSTVLPFMHSIAVVENQPPTETSSFIVGVGSQITMGVRRNIGFTWEPGKFSCWVILGMFLNLIRHRFKLNSKNNISFWILMATLLSTLSTTGYALLAVIILFYIMNRGGKARLLVIVLVSLLLPSIIGLSFMGEKIMGLSNVEGDITAVYYYSSQGQEVITPQRIAGFYFDILNFIHDFWLGYNQNENSYVSRVFFDGISVVMSNGVLNILAKYGIFVGIFFYYWLFRSSKYLSKELNYNGEYMFAILFLVMSISYDFWENCILMFFYLSSFYNRYPSYQISK